VGSPVGGDADEFGIGTWGGRESFGKRPDAGIRKQNKKGIRKKENRGKGTWGTAGGVERKLGGLEILGARRKGFLNKQLTSFQGKNTIDR